MNKQPTAGTKKASTATDKPKKKRITKIVKGSKAKTKKSNESTSILKETIIPSNTTMVTSESWSLTESIRQFVRMEVEDALMKTSNKRQIAQEALAKEKISHNNEYVKIEDLNDIVNKLISQQTDSILKRNSEQIRETANKVRSLEETLKTLTERMKSVEESVSEMRKGFLPTPADSMRVGRVTGMTKPAIRFQLPSKEHFNKELFNKEIFNKEPFKREPFDKETFNKELSNPDLPFGSSSKLRLGSTWNLRLPSGLEQKTFATRSSDESDDFESIDLESNPSSTGINKENSRAYDEIMRKFSPKTRGGEKQSELDVDPSMSSLEEDWQRRMAERLQIDSNMLRYKKSPLTLQLESHKNYFPNEKPKTPTAKTAPLTQSPQPRPVHPRLSRPGVTNSTDEAQSDWLFEQ